MVDFEIGEMFESQRENINIIFSSRNVVCTIFTRIFLMPANTKLIVNLNRQYTRVIRCMNDHRNRDEHSTTETKRELAIL